MENTILDMEDVKSLTNSELADLSAKILQVLSDRAQNNDYWEPVQGNQYWYFNITGGICRTKTTSSVTFLMELLNAGNLFRTEKEAIFKIEERKLLMEINRYIAKSNMEPIDWNNSKQSKFLIMYDDGKLDVDFINSKQYSYNIPPMTSLLIANKCIQIFGLRILKYIFNKEEK